MREDIYNPRNISCCWYKNICDKECTSSCGQFTQLDYMLQLSNLPLNCQDIQFVNSDLMMPSMYEKLESINEHIYDYVKKGINLYMHGQPGCGKTFWAMRFLKSYLSIIAPTNFYKCRGLFVFVPSLLRDLKLNITNPIKDIQEFINDIKNCDVVIWDDIFLMQETNFEAQWLYSLIGERMLAKKANIVTSNVSLTELYKTNKRLHSRLQGADVIELIGNDLRSCDKLL